MDSNGTPLFVLVNVLFILYGQDISVAPVHIVYLGDRQNSDPRLVTDSHHDILASVLGSYKHGFSGFAAKLTDSQAQKVADLPGVVHVIPNRLHKLQTTRSWDYLGLSSQSPSNLLHETNMGGGIIIGLLDTGVWPESEVFNDEGFGPIPSHWKGGCVSGELFNATTDCNRKLIGARRYIDGFLADNEQPSNTTENPDYLSPRDSIEHGTHTSTIASGSFVVNASYQGLGLGIVRGGAPRARIAMYKVCWNVAAGQCASADILKAFDEAIHDGVDVLSVSLGSDIPLFSEVDERDGIAIGSFHAVAKGMTVVCGASTDGPSAQSVQNTAPWILTVAASTIDRSFPTPITLGNNMTILGQAMFPGKEIGFSGLVHPETPGLLLTAAGVCESLSLNNTTVAGNVVLCFTTELGTKILFYIRSTSFPTVKLSSSKTLVGKPVSTKIAYFSSRGPSSIAPANLKPDIAAPSVSILAASSPLDPFMDGGFALHSGTSMATPHISGIVALLKALHPSWSPVAIKSALVTTAWRTDPLGEPIFVEGSPRKLADPFDYGGGIANPNKAAEPACGTTHDLPQHQGLHFGCEPTLNHHSNLRKSTTLTRKVTNVGPQNSMYKAMIEPPLGIPVTVRPDILVFNSTTKWKSPPPTRCEHWILFWKPNLDGWGAHCVKSHICEDTVDTILCR
ncbi:Subtilisin-like protease SBT3.6 [Vitis vinifera]|uniref:Subtilisin-like protease SBT3.6 n=1 Tax=Vitis vinifera TaxID=29760 RepID=A0A438I4L8_VITVI|nr:Subtilisin-like protease SBT3.6 [Vitis vinifera]